MSIRHGLLALLDSGPRHGYQLRAGFEQATGATWPLNIGQVYTTLSRLERDGLVEALLENEDGQRPYRITERGRDEVKLWFRTAVGRSERPRDELAVKLSLALITPGVDVAEVVQRQRTAAVRTMQEYTRLKRAEADLPSLLVVDALIFQTEAEIRWLDHCEATLLRLRRATPSQDRAADSSAATAEGLVP